MIIIRYLILLVHSIINVVLHSIGCYLLLLQQKRQSGDSPRDIFVINLSIIELVKNLTTIFSNNLVVEHTEENLFYLFNILWNMNFIYFVSMILITTDRLLAALLNLKYRVYCTYKRKRYIIVTQWMLGIIVTALSIKFGWLGNSSPFNGYFFVVSTVYLLFAIFTYCMIFKTFMRSRLTTQQTNGNISAFKMFRQSKFYVAVLLITSFIFFIILPDIVGFFMIITTNQGRHEMWFVAMWVFLRNISDTCDWCIYVFAKVTTRELFYKNICCCCRKAERSGVASGIRYIIKTNPSSSS